MGTFKVVIDTGNAAFQDGNLVNELSQVLARLSRRMQAQGEPRSIYALHDYNGNVVGNATYTEEE